MCFGKVVCVCFSASVDEEVFYFDIENEIPAGYRPSASTYVLGCDNNYNYVLIGLLTNGTVRIYSRRIVLDQCVCVFSYVL